MLIGGRSGKRDRVKTKIEVFGGWMMLVLLHVALAYVLVHYEGGALTTMVMP